MENIKYNKYGKSKEYYLNNKIRIYKLVGNDYEMGYAYGYFNKNIYNVNKIYNHINNILKEKFSDLEYLQLIHKINIWQDRMDENNMLDFYKGCSYYYKCDYRKIVFIIIICEIFGYFCTIITSQNSKSHFHFRICDVNKFIINIYNEDNYFVDVVNHNNEFTSISHSLTLSKHTVISNKFSYSVKSSYRTNYKINLNNPYPIILTIFETFKSSKNIDDFRVNLNELNLNDSTYVSCYDKNKMYLISLNKSVKDICEKKDFVEISDYSPVIKRALNLEDMFKRYKTIPDRNRAFTVVFDIYTNKLYVNNYLEKDEFISITLP